MASTYTSNTGIEKPGTGEQSGTWGDTVNVNSDILDRALNGVLTLGLSGTSSSLTTTDGTLSNGQYKLLLLGGSPSGAHTITVIPNNAQKIYFVYNTSGQDVIFSQGSGANATIPNGDSNVLYCDGGGAAAAVVDLSTKFDVTLSQLGVSATAAQVDYNVVATLGTSENSKTVTANADGDVTLSQELIAKSYNETFATAASSSGVLTVDCETGNVFQSTLTENVTTLTLSNPPVSGTSYALTLKIIQDSTARTFAWPASVNWAGGTAPTLSAASGAVDIYTLYTTDGGTNWYGFIGGQEFS